MRPTRITSNRLELLIQELKQHLFEDTDPFTRRMIVVSSPAMKAYLMQQLASDPRLQIAMGLEICYLEQALSVLNDQLFFSKPARKPSKFELAVGIEGLIRNRMNDQQPNLFGGN